MTTTTCATCLGTGAMIQTRTRWVGGTRDGYAASWTGAVRCDECDGAGIAAAVRCDTCDAMVARDDALPTIDDAGFVCLGCHEAWEAETLAANPDLGWLVPDHADPDVA